MELAEFVAQPEQREKAAQLQAERREKFGHRLPKTPAEAQYRFALGLEFAVNAGRDYLPASDTSDLRLAEAYFLQGRFDEAFLICPVGKQRDYYWKRYAAVNTPGAKTCKCEDFVIKASPTNGKGDKIPTQLHVEIIFNGQTEFRFYECIVCRSISLK